MNIRILAIKAVSAIAITIVLGACQSAGSPNTDRYSVVNDHRMHMSIEGNGDTVIFGAGSGVRDPAKDFGKITAILREQCTTAVYDRAGFGKSDYTGKDRDIETVVDELHDLFGNAGLSIPFVLVGHSIASLELIRYAQKYPDETKAVVLIEGTPPGLLEALMDDDMMRKAKLEAFFGLMKKATYAESIWWRRNAEKIGDEGSIGSIPIVYICRANADTGWLDKYSSKVEVVRMETGEHSIHRYLPDEVAAEILKAVRQ